MSGRDHEAYEESVAAYLLGSLPPLEAEAFEQHALRCASCREELERLRPSIDVIPRSVPQVAPPAGLKARLMDEVRAEAAVRATASPRAPRAGLWRRPAVAVAAAGVLALAGFGVAGLVGGGSGERTIAASVATARLAQDASAKLQVVDDGKLAVLRVHGLPSPGPGRVYQVWYQRAGRFVRGPSFRVDRSGDGAAAIPQGTRGSQAVLVTRERPGVSAPTEPPVITVPV